MLGEWSTQQVQQRKIGQPYLIATYQHFFGGYSAMNNPIRG